MRVVNMHEAKTQLSRLVESAVKGEPFVIARAGKPLVKVVSLDGAPEPTPVGFLRGKFEIPENFDKLGASEIESMFEGET